jgi:hypothetical protein
MMFRCRPQEQGRKKAIHNVMAGAPLAKIMREQMMMSAGIYPPSLRGTGAGTPNPVNTNVSSSMIQELEGLPKRLHGKTKY